MIRTIFCPKCRNSFIPHRTRAKYQECPYCKYRIPKLKRKEMKKIKVI